MLVMLMMTKYVMIIVNDDGQWCTYRGRGVWGPDTPPAEVKTMKFGIHVYPLRYLGVLSLPIIGLPGNHAFALPGQY